MVRLQYWQAQNVQSSYMDSLARYHALARTVRDKEALNQGLLIAIGQEAQKRRDNLIDGIDDSEILTAEQQEDIWSKAQEYQRIIFEVSELLQ